MGNRVNIQATEFKNIPSGSVTKGYRIWDDNAQSYDNTLVTLPEDDLELLAIVIEGNQVGGGEASAMLDFVQSGEHGVYINGDWHNWEEIKHLFD